MNEKIEFLKTLAWAAVAFVFLSLAFGPTIAAGLVVAVLVGAVVLALILPPPKQP